MSEGRTLLLLGAGGFVGTQLAAEARQAGLRVVPASRRGDEEALPCDLLDPGSISACVQTAKPDLVVNCAGEASVGRSWEHPAATFAVNASGVLNLLEALASEAPAAHLLCISSADVYGARAPGELPLGEALQPRPVTPYGAAKAAMEQVCGQYARGRGMRIAVVRAFNLIGPGQSPRFAVPSFARRIAEAERAGETELELGIGNPGAIRDFLDVRDGARALLELSSRELAGTYNLCSGSGTSIADLVGELAGSARLSLRTRQDPGLRRPVDPPALVGDPARLREATGFDAEISLTSSLADLLAAWRAEPPAG